MNILNSKYLDDFLTRSNHLNSNTARHKRSHITYFLAYLENKEIDISNLKPVDVYDYIDSLSLASQTISGIKFTIREFINFMYEQGFISFDGYKVFPVILTNKRDRILSYYSDEEIKLILKQIDIKKARFPLRNKCMILLASLLGLRASDIVGLKIDEIKWDKNIIEKNQKKTSNRVIVPIPINLKLLLIQYIKEERSKMYESDLVFLNPSNGNIYSTSVLYQLVDDCVRSSGIDTKNRKHGPHALRHSLATRLLSGNTPMPIITGILGHKNINTTSTYLSIDIEELRFLCLEVPTDGII